MPDEARTAFEIHESREGNAVRLRLTGELDLASAPTLKRRLEALRADRLKVQLDLSHLDFIDSTGLHILFAAFRYASADGWAFGIDPNVAPQVMRVLQMVNLDQLIHTEQSSDPDPS